jgi:Glycogen recognition site of AMP-activated protein kinase
MNEQLHRFLDGEIPLAALPPELQAEALRWQARFEAARSESRGGMPAGLAARIERALPAGGRRTRWRRAADWMLRPRTLRVSPLALGAAAAAGLLLVLSPWQRAGPTQPEPGMAQAPLYVEFVLSAPGARSVAVAGDFTTWSPDVELQDADGDGVWVGRVAILPGLHRYMFVVDGSQWVTDPKASRHADDGFGNRNAVLLVPQLGT